MRVASGLRRPSVSAARGQRHSRRSLLMPHIAVSLLSAKHSIYKTIAAIKVSWGQLNDVPLNDTITVNDA